MTSHNTDENVTVITLNYSKTADRKATEISQEERDQKYSAVYGADIN
jgi:hypothetical protein